MPTPLALARRYRYALVALAVSFGVHAALIVGIPGQLVKAFSPEAATYTAELTALPEPRVAQPGPAAPAPRAPRPRSPRKPGEALASLPPLGGSGVESVAEGLPALADALPELAPEPQVATREVPQPEMLAAALPATPVPALEPPRFPVEALPPQVSIQYALTSPFADGTAEYSWKREGDRYEIYGAAQATGFFTLFLEGQVQQMSSGTVSATGLRPERFTERKPNGPEEGLAFDWANRKLEFRRNDEVKAGELTDNTVDWLSMIFQLAHTPPQGASLDMKVYTQRRLYSFTLKVMGVEELKLPMGTVKALHLRHATNDSRETVDVWLGIDNHYLPVKLRYPVAKNRFWVEQTATAISTR